MQSEPDDVRSDLGAYEDEFQKEKGKNWQDDMKHRQTKNTRKYYIKQNPVKILIIRAVH